MEKIAVKIFEKHGMSFASAERAGGWTNCVWLNGDAVLRLSSQQHSDRIRREAALGSLLPESVGYPLTIATGVEEGYEWSLTERLNGSNAYDAWTQLVTRQKKDLLRQTWDIISCLQSMDIEKVSPLVKRHPWYSSFEPDEAHALLGHFVREGLFTAGEAAALTNAQDDFFAALPASSTALNHGDVTVENLFWDTEGRVHLFDFEHALIAPPQVDVYSFLRIAFHPPKDDYLQMDELEEAILRKEAVKLARPRLANKRDAALLLGCAVLISLRRLEIWLGGEEEKSGFRDWEPYLCLMSFVERKGGFLEEVIGNVL